MLQSSSLVETFPRKTCLPLESVRPHQMLPTFYSAILTNTFRHLDKYIQKIWTNTFRIFYTFKNLDKYIQNFLQIHSEIWTNTFRNFDTYLSKFYLYEFQNLSDATKAFHFCLIQQFVQLHLEIWANITFWTNRYNFQFG